MSDEEKRRESKNFCTVIVICCSLLLAIILGTNLYENNKIKSSLGTRNEFLDLQENTKQWLMQDLELWFLVNSESSYERAKEKMHLTKDLRTSLFGKDYNIAKNNFLGATEVIFADVQYTLDGSDTVYYVLADIKTDGTVKVINLLVYIADNKIYNIVAY